MSNTAVERVWSYVTSVSDTESLFAYLKFLKSKALLDEIFFYLQRVYLLDYGFAAIAQRTPFRDPFNFCAQMRF